MSRLVRISLALLVVALVFSGCAGKTFTHDKHPFKIKVPPGWKTTRQGAGVFVWRDSPLDEHARYNVIVHVHDWARAKTLDQFEQEEGLTANRGQWGPLIDTFETTIAGEKARGYEYDGDPKSINYILFHDGTPYLIMLDARKPEFAKMKPILQGILGTLAWTD